MVYFDDPYLSDEEKEALIKVIESNYVSSSGTRVGEFEKKFAEFHNIDNAVAVNSGTSAIHSALYELGIGEGDEVVVPVLTFIATVNPVIYVGAKPVFVDVDLETWNIIPEKIEKSITERTKAIIPVHLYGNPCAMDQIMDIAKRKNIFVIEDATESLGAKYREQFTGTFGDRGCFSFNGNKVITTGSGGMVVGHNEKQLQNLRFLINQAKDPIKAFYHPKIGFNYRMTNMEAALGIVQLERLNAFLRKKKIFHEIYKNVLSDLGYIEFQKTYGEGDSSYWMTCIRFTKNINIADFQNKLKLKGIPTRRIFRPLTESDPYKSFKKNDYRNSYELFETSISLPSSMLNNEGDIEHAAKTIKSVSKDFLKRPVKT